VREQTLAVQVSGGVAAGWLLGAAVVGFVCAVAFWPPIVAWWWHVTSVTRLGFEYLVYCLGIVALCGGAIYLISKTV
jgi:hypothetical protein